MPKAYPPLKSGDLRTQIEIMRSTETDNGKGGYTTSWDNAATPWAEVLGQDGREAFIAQAMQGVSNYRIRIRYRPDVSASDQIRLGGAGGTDLNIGSCNDPNGDREQLVIFASTASAAKTI